MSEEKAGPGQILKSPSQALLEDVHRLLRTVARMEVGPSEEAELVRERVGRLLGAMKTKRLDDQQVFASWKPTPDNIKALPAPIRAHIEDCEMLIKENESLREQLSVKLLELEEAISKREAWSHDVSQMFLELKELVA